MPCFHPLTGWRSQDKTASGKRRLQFQVTGSFGDALEIACGQCIGCRLERARQWSLRLMHEAQFHDQKAFITATYTDSSVPRGGSLSIDDYQRFLKRLRRRISPQRVRFFGCGEYGDITFRPHYHLILFGWDAPDKRLYSRSTKGDGEPLYTSQLLDDIWGLGSVRIGSVTQQSAGYVARYCVKKVTGTRAEAHYGTRTPEFMTCSNGIGKQWFERYRTDLYPDDFAVMKGRRYRVPEYYDRQLPEEELAELKAKRKERARKFRHNQTPQRLTVREEVTRSRIQSLKRDTA